MSKRDNQRQSRKAAMSRSKINLEGTAKRDSMRAARRNYGQGVSPDRGLKHEEEPEHLPLAEGEACSVTE